MTNRYYNSHFLILSMLLAACTTVVEHTDRIITATDCDTIFVDPDDTSSDGSSSTTGETTGETTSTGETVEFVCPEIVNGDVVFDLPEAGVSRTAYFVNVSAATGQGPLFEYFPGTFETPEGVLPWSPIDSDPQWGPRQGLRPQAENTGGILAIIRADPSATGRVNNPYPYWPVCDPIYLSDPAYGCDREDDYELAEMIALCVVEQGLADPDRINAGGMSAGGIFVSKLLEQPAGALFAGVVSWSGGESSTDQPTTRTGTTSTMVLHGGPTDQFCAPYLSTGCYSFVQPSEQLAEDTDAVITCNHGSGHSANIAGASAEFLSAARLGQSHPWQGFPVGAGGWQPGPQMGGGAAWVLRNDCDPF